jgi:LacI family transcriptional regulator
LTTIKQIAIACGVSVASVSKALHDAPDIGVETAKRIKETAFELGYYPNASARTLKTNRSFNLGILFEDDTHSGVTHEYFSQIINSFKLEVERRGFDITFISENQSGRRMSYLEHSKYRGFDGILIANAVNYSIPAVIELIDSGLPVVMVDQLFEKHSVVNSDNLQSMRELVKHVASKGHRKIAYIRGQDTLVTRDRLTSFITTCKELGISIPHTYMRQGRYHEPRITGEITKELLNLPDRPTCILFPDDFSLIGGINEIERAGLRIPEDISIVGYDGILLSQVLRPRLTTLKQDAERLGQEAAKLLVEEIVSPKTFIPRKVVVPGYVQEGETVRTLG